MNNHHNPLDVLAGIRREYDEAVRLGARADQIAHIAARMIPLLGQTLHMPVTQELAGAFNDSLQRWISQLRRDPFLTLILAEFLHTRINTIERAADELARATDSPGRSAEISRHRERMLSASSIPRHVHQQARSLAHILRQTIDDCKDLAQVIPTVWSALAAEYPTEQQAIGHLTTAPDSRGVATERPILSASQPEPTLGLVRLRTRVCLTRQSKMRHLTDEVGVFHRSLHQELRLLHLAIDEGAQFGARDPLTLSSATTQLVEISKLAIVTCDQVADFAEWAAG